MATTARVLIRLKKSVLDPQGTTILDALKALGFVDIQDVRVGKLIEITIPKTTDDISLKNNLTSMADKLLANPVIEDFEVLL